MLSTQLSGEKYRDFEDHVRLYEEEGFQEFYRQLLSAPEAVDQQEVAEHDESDSNF